MYNLNISDYIDGLPISIIIIKKIQFLNKSIVYNYFIILFILNNNYII